MTVFLEFTVRQEEFGLGEALDVDSTKRIDLMRFVPIGESFVPYLWAETTDDERFESAVEASPHVAEIERLDGTTGRTLYRVDWNGSVDGLFDAIRSHDVAIHEASTTDEEWRFRLVAADREAFVEFSAACRMEGIPVTVRQISGSNVQETVLYGLTEKQRAALLLAYESGYYDDEERVTLGELSAELGITQQSFSSRLKRGVGTLIRNTIAVSDAGQ